MRATIASLFRRLPRFLRRHRLAKVLLRLGCLDAVQTVTFNGNARAEVDIRDAEARNVFLSGEFEPHFFKLLAPFLKDAQTYFDIGGNSGFCSFGVAATSQHPMQFYIFEANAVLCQRLRNSALLYPKHQFAINEGCVSDRAGFSSFETDAHSLGGHCLKTETTEGVPNILLDEYVQKLGIESVDFVKMDIEGSEISALNGWKKFLSEGRAKVMYVEVCAGTLKVLGHTTQSLIRKLNEVGYQCFYCKQPEIGLPEFIRLGVRKITVQGESVFLIPCTPENVPADFQSDVLAFPSNSPFLAD